VFSPKSPGRERERRIGERTWVVLAQIKIVFKFQNFQKIFF
jgi:hypothetical protein